MPVRVIGDRLAVGSHIDFESFLSRCMCGQRVNVNVQIDSFGIKLPGQTSTQAFIVKLVCMHACCGA